jgi:hypothetical protein
MKPRTKNAWLFAFTDLSFLLLICLSLIPSAPADISLHLAEMKLPTVPDNPNLQPPANPAERWELQIFPVTPAHSVPYRLVRAGEQTGLALDETSLMPALEKLRRRGIRPILLPEKTSLTQDFLFAAGAMARVWSNEAGRSVVRPMTPEKVAGR